MLARCLHSLQLYGEQALSSNELRFRDTFYLQKDSQKREITSNFGVVLYDS